MKKSLIKFSITTVSKEMKPGKKGCLINIRGRILRKADSGAQLPCTSGSLWFSLPFPGNHNFLNRKIKIG